MNLEYLPTAALWVGIIILVAIISYLANKQKQKRTEELRALANQLGFAFREDGLPLPGALDAIADLFHWSDSSEDRLAGPDFFPFFDVFDRGSSRDLCPAIVGKDAKGIEWYLFDYQYTVSTGKTSTTYCFSMVLAKTSIAFPTMTLTPEGFGHSVAKVFGMKDMQLESEEFNKRYFIKTSDERLTLDLLHPLAMETLLAQPTHEWNLAGPFVMVQIPRNASASEFGVMKGCVQEFLSHIPAYYRQDNGPQGATT